jgi:hypothetical protein
MNPMPDEFDIEFEEQSAPLESLRQFHDFDHDEKGLPYSEASERGVIASVLMEPSYFHECEKLSPYSFYIYRHRIIWAAMQHIQRHNDCLDSVQLFEFLATNNGSKLPAIDRIVDQNKILFEQVGGPRALSTIESSIEYAVDIGRLRIWIDLIHQSYISRRGVVIMNQAIERIRGGERAIDVFSDSRWQLEWLERQEPIDKARPITDFTIPDHDDDSILLGENRYLCRGGQLIIAGPSSVGKSSMSLQMAICFALGKDFLGIKCRKPLKSLIVQAEDDEGDIAEVWESIKASLNLNDEELKQIKKNVIIVPNKTHTGDEFIARLEVYIRRYTPDLVMLNPLLSYIGGDITRQDIASAFLRNGLNRINREDKWAYIILHHTTKPSKEKSAKWQDTMYNMAGASELINWARAIIIVQPLEEEGHFILNLAKRGKRAGVKEIEEGKPYAKLITKIPAAHASGTVEINGRHMPRIEWVVSNRSKQLRDEVNDADKRGSSGREQTLTWDDIKNYVPTGFANAKKLSAIQRDLIADGIIESKQKRTAYRRIKDAESNGIVAARDDLKYYIIERKK